MTSMIGRMFPTPQYAFECSWMFIKILLRFTSMSLINLTCHKLAFSRHETWRCCNNTNNMFILSRHWNSFWSIIASLCLSLIFYHSIPITNSSFCFLSSFHFLVLLASSNDSYITLQPICSNKGNVYYYRVIRPSVGKCLFK